jgi:2-amino-4-hydroxy-6-hydroxymethyldihydropteridine diphosphokinase
MAEALLAFGGNLGDPRDAIERAVARLAESGVVALARSAFYRTAPWGPVPQPDFVNACAIVRTELAPEALLRLCQATERACGRVPGTRWGPRALDIDILDHGGLALDVPGLTLPHPRIAERAFVLVPLAEIAAERMVGGRRVADMLAAIDTAGVDRLAEAAPS